MFEVSPQIKDYWPRRSPGHVTALTVGGNHAASHNSPNNSTGARSSTDKSLNSSTGASDANDVARPKHIVEENGDKPLYYQKEAARTKISKL